jgi:3-deoxy-manno-octulosonate cytidylyltransferase (CMP-KDO synthetase)
VHDYGFEAVMTRQHHQNGTERLSEVVKLFGWVDDTIVVNLQGDEPLLPPAYIIKIAHMLATEESTKVATLAAAIETTDDIFNPSCVKVVLDKHQYALYFSRAAIPWERAFFSTTKQPSDVQFYLRHIGLYAYTAGFLKQYCQWSASPLEQIESLEQLRILWYGEKILVHTVEQIPPASVDTIEDLQRVEKIIANSFF